MINIDAIDSSYSNGIKIAEEWEGKNNLPKARSIYVARLGNVITVSTMKYSTVDDAIDYLISRNAEQVLTKVISLTETLSEQVIADRTRIAYVGDPSYHAPLISLAWLLNCDHSVISLLKLTNSIIYKKMLTGNWKCMVELMNCFVEHKDCESIEKSIFTGTLKHINNYLELMKVITNGGEVSNIIETIDKDFLARQKNKRSIIEAPVTLGSAENPVKWDFWKESIMAYANRHYDV